MTVEQVENLKVGEHVCFVTWVAAGEPTEKSRVMEPKRVLKVTGKGLVEKHGKDYGKPWVIFWHEAYIIRCGILIENDIEEASCYGQHEYYIIPNQEQRERWTENVSYEEFMQLQK